MIQTAFYEPLAMGAEAANEIAKKHIIGRVGNVSDTSTAIAYLADNNISSFLTGRLHVVDGGYLLS